MANRNSAAASQYPEVAEELQLEEYRFEYPQVDVIMPETRRPRVDPEQVARVLSRSVATKPRPFLVLAMERYLDSQKRTHFEYQPANLRAWTHGGAGLEHLLVAPAPVLLIPIDPSRCQAER